MAQAWLTAIPGILGFRIESGFLEVLSSPFECRAGLAPVCLVVDVTRDRKIVEPD